jgi:hypothetical protein
MQSNGPAQRPKMQEVIVFFESKTYKSKLVTLPSLDNKRNITQEERIRKPRRNSEDK